MSTRASESVDYKLVTTAGVANAETLGTSSQSTVGLTLRGQKALNTSNTGNVYVRPVGSTAWWEITPGESLALTYIPGLHQTLDQYQIYSDNNGDGVLIWRVAGGNYIGP